MNETSTIHSVASGLIYAILTLSFSMQYKIKCFNPLSMPLADGKQHEDKFCTAAKYCRYTLS